MSQLFVSAPGSVQASPLASQEVEVSVILPCLNEAETVGECIAQIQSTFEKHGISGEIVVADNGSRDASAIIADAMGARVINVARKGYGSALMGGIEAARGRYVVMGDSDCSYDFRDIPNFIAELQDGCDLVMGNRFRGGIRHGAMPLLHRYLGNPVLTGLGRLFFKSECGDFHCGLRAFRKSAYDRMNLRTTGMEFASEMVVKATLFGMRVSEVPTTLSPDARSRPPHLRSWRDGWRHLRFLLLYSPRWLFLYPGTLLMLLGTAAGIFLLPGPRKIGGIVLDIHTLLYAALAVLVGFQAVLFALFTKVFAITEGLLPEDPSLKRLFKIFTLEIGLVAGLSTQLAGVACAVYSVLLWNGHGFGNMDPSSLMRVVVLAVGLVLLGVEITLSSFFFSVLGLARK
ncbi:MAG TPA: glycosyltransferase [Terriglobales bacterium]|nr:glycosyltransferase [Terriglobales bacterium]